VELVTRVQEDPEERIAEPVRDDLVDGAGPLANPQRPVPLGDRLEVGADEPLDVVADSVRQLVLALDNESGPTVQCAPDAEGGREPITSFDCPIARTEKPEGRSRTGGQHQVA
jgi:hypothetical protein